MFNNFFTTTKLLLDSLLSQTKNDNYIDVIVLDNGSTDDSLHHLKEYLKIILLSKKPDAYRNILAITFTNKAVHEMKSRVLESLSQFSRENPSEKALQLMQDISSDTGLSLNAITEKAKSIIKNLIHNYAAFDISTIDKFTHKVIRAFAHDLNLPITFEVSLDTEILLTEAVDAIIAEAGNDEELTKLLVDFTMEKTDDDKSWDISRESKTAFKCSDAMPFS